MLSSKPVGVISLRLVLRCGMRVLLTIPHYFAPQPSGRHASLRACPEQRAAVLLSVLQSLHATFALPQCVLDIERRAVLPANQSLASELQVVICTTGGRHLLDQLPGNRPAFLHIPTNAEPRLLGYECHAVLQARLAEPFDWFGYLEDDLLLRDPLFFLKLNWFTRLFGEARVLQPNRYEVGPHPVYHKAYIDGPIRRAVTEPYQNIDDQSELMAEVLGQSVLFQRVSNPHSGCFFLTRHQLRHWSQQPYYLDRSSAFIGPLESAATLGLVRSFRVYKPAPINASFLEIQHSGSAFLSLIRATGSTSPKSA